MRPHRQVLRKLSFGRKRKQVVTTTRIDVAVGLCAVEGDPPGDDGSPLTVNVRFHFFKSECLLRDNGIFLRPAILGGRGLVRHHMFLSKRKKLARMAPQNGTLPW